MTWATSVPILVFLSLYVLDLGSMFAIDRQASDARRASYLNAAYPRGGGIVTVRGISLHPFSGYRPMGVCYYACELKLYSVNENDSRNSTI